MKALILLFCLALLPCLVLAAYANSDGNVSDTNFVADFNGGPIVLRVSFGHTVIGSSDLNAKGWFFESSEDYAFNMEAPSLELFYVLDFRTNSVYEYEGLVPVGWEPVLSLTNSTASFRVSNLLGDCDGDLFVLSKRDSGLEITHLEVGEWNTIVSVGLTDFFFMFDADDYGTCTFLLDLDEFEVNVSVAFNEMPSYWGFIESKGFACEENPEHRCLVIPGTGESWDIDECLNPENEKNKFVGDVPGIEICVQGSFGYDSWYTKTLEVKYSAEQEAKKAAEDTGDVETSKAVEDNTAAIIALVESISFNNLATDKNLTNIFVLIIFGGGLFFGGKIYKSQSSSIKESMFFVKKKFKEAKENGFSKKQEERRGKGSEVAEEGKGGGVAGAGGDRAEGQRLQWFQRK